eukprot:6181163-Pleurochrysis_carterae.AAC.1
MTARGNYFASFGTLQDGAAMDALPRPLQRGRTAQSCTAALPRFLGVGVAVHACARIIPLSVDELLDELTSIEFNTFNADDITNFFTSFNSSENALVLSVVVVIVSLNIVTSLLAHFRLHRRALGQARAAREKRRAMRIAASAKYKQDLVSAGTNDIEPDAVSDSGPGGPTSASDAFFSFGSSSFLAAARTGSNVTASSSSLRYEVKDADGILQSRLTLRLEDHAAEVRREFYV